MTDQPTPAAEHTLGGNEQALEKLRTLRGSIDNLDAALVHLLAERFKCTQEVGELKAAHDLPPADPAREADQIARLRRLAADAGSTRRSRRSSSTSSSTRSCATTGRSPRGPGRTDRQ